MFPCGAGVSRDEDVEPGTVAARATDSAIGRRGRQPGLRVRIEGRTFHQHLPEVRLPQYQHEGKAMKITFSLSLFTYFHQRPSG